MGLFNFSKKKLKFLPNLDETEYENWLCFLEQGGNTQEWNKLKKENNWKFRTDVIDEYSEFVTKFRPLYKQYSNSASIIKKEWVAISSDKDYFSLRVEKFEKLCRENIGTYNKMVVLENEYGEDHLQESEGYKRLAMLYEKQGEFEKAVLVCRDAIFQGDIKSMPSRLARMIKKLNRVPTQEELRLIEKAST